MSMTIVSKDQIRAAYGRCIDAALVHDQAIHATAQALCLPVETVREVVEETQEVADA